MSSVPLRMGVVGVGALGQHHARVYHELPDCELAGVFDANHERAAEVAARHDVRPFDHLRELVDAVDAVSVAVPTVDHHRVAHVLIEAGRDVLIEKPITANLPEADELVALAERRGRILQVGHTERFNPASEALARIGAPRFIEVHRLAPFSARSLDIDVVLDLMIHDLDLLLSLDASEAVQLDAIGVPVLTSKFDIANARLRFASGLTANLTASRISTEKMRKFRVWSTGGYVSADLAARQAQVYLLRGLDGPGGPDVEMDLVGDPDEEPLKRQLAAFLESVRTRATPIVSGADGRRALALAHEITAKMETSIE